MSEVTQLAESLHPHEVKVVSALKASAQREGGTPPMISSRSGSHSSRRSSASSGVETPRPHAPPSSAARATGSAPWP